ncbi:recombinase family protein [Streptomyces sp. AK08-02]|uniref:recombinase family protein n=1 Tax=Streptomyces sp. AK08-02 TaxID=3028654 RepID=UPI0029A2A429|nr:recombinase family protein [Streptomyces sp. AK08-02]MDX3748692.1 recombinase family protein [Streptomyces sp. AK08-02]
MAEDLIARDYRRLSDRKGGTSVKDQGVDNAASAAENGWVLHSKPYVDDGLSASRYAKKKRDDFEQLLADLQSGPSGRESQFGADVLMLWESSRGSRKVGEWVSFIELCEEKRVRIWVTTHERLYDPSNGRDRKSLIEDAVDSEYESYKTHRRVSRSAAAQARLGRPYGEAPYGLMPVYDPKTGKLANWVEDPARSIVARELFRLLERHVSMGEITRRFERRGYTNRSGRPFTHEHLADMARRHSYAGIRAYKGTLYEAVWDGIVPQKRFWNVQRFLDTPGRATYRGGGARHELTAGLLCAKCDGPFRVQDDNSNRRKPTYRCQAGCMNIQKAPVDDLLIGREGDLGLLLEYLAREDIYELLAAPPSSDASLVDLQTRLAAARAERDEMRDAKGANLAQVLVLANSLAAKELEVAGMEAQERELTLPSVVLSIIKPGVDVWQSWCEAPIAGRRQLVRLILSPRYLGYPYVLPSPRTGPNQPVLERIVWRNVRGAIPALADRE